MVKMKNDKNGYIRRKDVFEMLKRTEPLDGQDDSKERFRYIQWLSTYHAINSIEPVDVASVIHGRWDHGREISRDYQGKNLLRIWYEDWHCSICHTVVKMPDPKWKYCPYCGAKMDLDLLEGGKNDTI